MKKIFLIILLVITDEKMYCQSLKNSDDKSYAAYPALTRNNFVARDSTKQAKIKMKAKKKVLCDTLRLMPLTFEAGKFYPVMDYYKYKETLKGMSIPY